MSRYRAITCAEDGCSHMIVTGVAYRCGGTDMDAGCGKYFCGEHLYIELQSAYPPQMCAACWDAEAQATEKRRLESRQAKRHNPALAEDRMES